MRDMFTETFEQIRYTFRQIFAELFGGSVMAENVFSYPGLGSAVSEVVCEECPVPVLRVGVMDTFGKSGPAADLLKLFGLSAEHIVEEVKKAVALRG